MTARVLSRLLLLLLFALVGAIVYGQSLEADRIQAQAAQPAGAAPKAQYPGGVDHRGLARERESP